MGKQSRRVREKTGKHPSNVSNMINATMVPQMQIVKESIPTLQKEKPVLLENPDDYLKSVQCLQFLRLLQDSQLPWTDISTDISCRPINETKLRIVKNMSGTNVLILFKNKDNEHLFANVQRWLLETIYQVELSNLVYAGSLMMQYQGAIYIATSDEDMVNMYATIQSYVATLQSIVMEDCFIHCSDTKLLGSANFDKLKNKSIMILPMSEKISIHRM